MVSPRAGHRIPSLRTAAIVAAVAAILCSAILAIALITREHTLESNRDLTCNIADLVAHVPAVQFEGESTANFVGWIDATRRILDTATECSDDIQAAIDRRVEKNRETLE